MAALGLPCQGVSDYLQGPWDSALAQRDATSGGMLVLGLVPPEEVARAVGSAVFKGRKGDTPCLLADSFLVFCRQVPIPCQ